MTDAAAPPLLPATGGGGGEGRIGVRLVTGFLGSGKTTLLNAVLTQEHGLGRIGVIENEYGAVGVDGGIIADKVGVDETPVIELSNGCLCCEVRGDLKRALLRMAAQRPRVDCILLEASGVADPGPIVQTLLGDKDVAAVCELRGVITVVDALHFTRQLRCAEHPQLRPQIAFADLLILNKADLVDPTRLAEAREAVRRMNTHASIVTATMCAVDLQTVLRTEWFDKPEATAAATVTSGEGEEEVAAAQGEKSAEGVLQHRAALNSVETLSIALDEGVLMNVAAVELWLSDLVYRHGEKLYRYKGTMAVKGCEGRKYLFQGVHRIFGGEPLSKSGWTEECPPRCQMVFIGKGLADLDLRAGLEGCVAPSKLRFALAETVECATPCGWQEGEVTGHWKDGCPYLVQIFSRVPNVPGRKVMAPVDSDTFIRAPVAGTEGRGGGEPDAKRLCTG